jgi:signal transduction histidine kinase
MDSKEVIYLITIIVFILLLVFITFFIFYYSFFKKKNQFIKKKIELELHLQSELSKAKMEIKDQTLSEVSRELHDNIGQIFSVVKMQLNYIKNKQNIQSEDINEIIENVSNGIEELRFISKIINRDITLKDNIIISIKNDLERIERLKKIKCIFNSEFENIDMIIEHELILYRIFQEAITNSIKHSESSEIQVKVFNNNSNFVLEIIDKGIGFQSNINDGSGLFNMKTRAKLIGATIFIESNNGTKITINYPLKLIKNT